MGIERFIVVARRDFPKSVRVCILRWFTKLEPIPDTRPADFRTPADPIRVDLLSMLYETALPAIDTINAAQPE